MCRRYGLDEGTQDAPLSPAERFAQQFYGWEQRGRGWLLWDDPVRPEPPFARFAGYRLPQQACQDDGRRHTLLSGLVQWLSRVLTGGRNAEPSPMEDGDDGAEALDDILAETPEDLTELRMTVPADSTFDEGASERFLLSAASCRSPLSFEVIGLAEETVIQIACARADLAHVRAQLQAQFPEAALQADERFLAARWEQLDSAATVVVEFGLSREFVLPLVGSRSLQGDLLAGLAGTLEQVEEGELAMLQVIFEPVRHPWAASVLHAVATPEGDGVFGGPTDMLEAAKAKVGRPLYAAMVRVACRSATRQRSWDLARRLGRGLDALADPMGNELIALDDEGYDEDRQAEDVVLRRCRRSGIILNADELAALVHPPSAAVRSAKLSRGGRRTRPAPAAAQNGELVLGVNEHAGRTKRVTLTRDQRVRHVHVIGASGTGKSTLLLNLILQDVARGEGLAVLDPHGDLVDAVLDRIPAARADDVVLFDPADEDHPVGFNILAAHSETEKLLLASDLVGVFRRLSASWGDQMNAVLANAVLAFLESDRGGTLADLRRFLIEKPFREEFLGSVRDPHVVYYWRKEFPLLVGRPQAPVLTRLDTFLRPRPLRHVVAQRDNRLDFADIMDRGKIFLARLAHGAIGEENTYLLGSLLVSKFHQIALGRQQVREEQRRHFWLYVDEFHHFATPSMASLLAGVRKYRLGLVLAHQELHQLESRDPDVASAVLANAYTRVCFRVGDHDARKLKDGFASFGAADLQSLGTGDAVCRVERADFDFSLRVPPVAPIVDGTAAAKIREGILARSRERYATTREAVEAQLRGSAEAAEAVVPASPGDPRSGAKRSGQSAVSPEPTPPPTPPSTGSPEPRTPLAAPPDAPTVPGPAPLPSSAAARPGAVARPVADVKLMGRGGPEHKYLQQLVKQWGDGMGFRSTIERPILDGQGSVDVALERPGLAIACLISITTPDAWELASVRKCLQAGFAPVMMVCPNAKHSATIRQGIEPNLSAEERRRVHFVSTDAMFGLIQQLEIATPGREKTVRGYKVKTDYKVVGGADGDDRRQAVSRVIAGALNRMRTRK